MLKNLKKWQIIIISPICVMIAMFFVFFLKGIYPFGTDHISYYDMTQLYIPLYYHAWDVLHGAKSIFFDWYSGAGGTMMDIMGNYVISPFNLLLYLTSRENIIYFMSYFLVFKLCFASAAMSFYSVTKFKNIGNFWHVVVGILYASSGYLLQYYTNIHFMDIIAIFPLLIWAYERMINKGKAVWYTVLMAVCCLISIYFAGLFCPFLVLYGVVLVRKLEKSDRKKAVFRIAFFTMSAILVSGIVSVPTIITLINSNRNTIVESATYLQNILTTEGIFDVQKGFMLFGCELPAAVIMIYCIKNGKKGIKKIAGELIVLLALLLPIMFESVNIALHLIGYMEFPMRFGYILNFMCLILMEQIIQIEHEKRIEDSLLVKAETIEPESGNEKSDKKTDYKYVLGIIGIVFVLISAFVLYKFASDFLDAGVVILDNYKNWGIPIALIFITYLIILLSDKSKYTKYIILCMIAAQVLIGWYGFIAPVYDARHEGSDVMVFAAEELRDAPKYEESKLDRIKDCSALFTSNYGFILEKATMANWTWGTNQNLVYAMNRMGYSNSYTRILEAGGTIFTDMLLNVKETITINEPSEELYSVYDKSENLYINKMNYEYPFGIMVDDNFFEWDENVSATGLEYQNELHKQLIGSENDLFSIASIEEYFVDAVYDSEAGVYYYYYLLPVDNKSVLYIENTNPYNNLMHYAVNGEWLKIPSWQELDNIVYPSLYNNGLIEGGVFENEDVYICIASYLEREEATVNVGLLDLAVLENGAGLKADETNQYEATKNGLMMDYMTEKEGYVFLPVGYSENWKAAVNGKDVQIKSGIDDAFVFIPVEAGNNNIELKYIPYGLEKGILVTLVGIILCALGFLAGRRLESNKILQYGTCIGYYGIAMGIVIVMYIVPILGNIYALLFKR